jgi:hypothetical protein
VGGPAFKMFKQRLECNHGLLPYSGFLPRILSVFPLRPNRLCCRPWHSVRCEKLAESSGALCDFAEAAIQTVVAAREGEERGIGAVDEIKVVKLPRKEMGASPASEGTKLLASSSC